jgi:hypothetical protein
VDMKRRMTPLFLLLFSVCAQLVGCYYIGPGPVAVAPASSTSYDFVWDNALGAAEEAGIQITLVDNRAGMIYGKRGSTDVKVVIIRQYDGRTRVELDMKGQQEQTQVLADDFFRAYDRYMERRSP